MDGEDCCCCCCVGWNQWLIHPKPSQNFIIYQWYCCCVEFWAGCYIFDVEPSTTSITTMPSSSQPASMTEKAVQHLKSQPHGTKRCDIHPCGRRSGQGWSERSNEGHSLHIWSTAWHHFVLLMAVVITWPKWKMRPHFFCWAIIANDILKLISTMWTFPICWNYGLNVNITLVMNFSTANTLQTPKKHWILCFVP